ncbi:MAG: MBL fold metallo-hydrolase [Pseudomonadota bacterium]
MKLEKIGRRGVLFNFGEGDAAFNFPTSVYMINSNRRLFLCDTHIGPKSMDAVKKYISDNKLGHKELFIFNTHVDADHIWGNCAFENAVVIASIKAEERLRERGIFDYERLTRFHNGNVQLRFPDITFDGKLAFAEDGIEFAYAPGHTADSSICIDKKDSVVFAGDLLEYPMPAVNHHDVEGFLNSLKLIEGYKTETVISSHSGIISKALLQDSICYLRGLIDHGAAIPVGQRDAEWMEGHRYNTKNLMYLRHEKKIREKLGSSFDYASFKRDFWRFVDPGYGDMGREFEYFGALDYDALDALLQKYEEQLAGNKTETEVNER